MSAIMTPDTKPADDLSKVPQSFGPLGPFNPELCAALVAAQKEMKNPDRDEYNDHLKSHFASLASVRNAVLPALTNHGIAVIQDVRTTDKGVACRTILVHETGAFIAFDSIEIPALKMDAQALGSAETYARRYSLLAAAVVAGEGDDDGEGASEPPKPISDAEAHNIELLLSQTNTSRQEFLSTLDVKSVRDIPSGPIYRMANALLRRKLPADQQRLSATEQMNRELGLGDEPPKQAKPSKKRGGDDEGGAQ